HLQEDSQGEIDCPPQKSEQAHPYRQIEKAGGEKSQAQIDEGLSADLRHAQDLDSWMSRNSQKRRNGAKRQPEPAFSIERPSAQQLPGEPGKQESAQDAGAEGEGRSGGSQVPVAYIARLALIRKLLAQVRPWSSERVRHKAVVSVVGDLRRLGDQERLYRLGTGDVRSCRRVFRTWAQSP